MTNLPEGQVRLSAAVHGPEKPPACSAARGRHNHAQLSPPVGLGVLGGGGSAAGRGQRVRGGVAILPRARAPLAAAAVAEEEAARQRVPYRAEAGRGKVAGRRGAARRRAARATSSRGLASEEQPWTTSVSAGGRGRSGRGPAAADPTLAPGWAAHGAYGPGLCGPLFAAALADPDPVLGVQGPTSGKGSPLPGQTSLACRRPSLGFPTPTSELLPTGLGLRGCFFYDPLCSLQATSHFAHCPQRPPSVSGI